MYIFEQMLHKIDEKKRKINILQKKWINVALYFYFI